MLRWLILVVNLKHLGRGDSQLIFCLHCIGLWCLDLWTRLWAFTCWLISAERPSHVDSICFGQVVLRCIKKRAEQVRGSKPGSSIPLYSLLQFLPPHSCLGVLSWWTVHKINFVPPKLVWVFFFITVIKNKINHMPFPSDWSVYLMSSQSKPKQWFFFCRDWQDDLETHQNIKAKGMYLPFQNIWFTYSNSGITKLDIDIRINVWIHGIKSVT